MSDSATYGRTLGTRRTAKQAAGGGNDKPLARAHAAFEQSDWLEAHRLLLTAQAAARLSAPDLERLAEAAYLIGSEDEALEHFEHAHRAHLEAGDALRAMRCAFWQGLLCVFRGDVGRAGGWFGRAARLLEGYDDVVERGYMLLPLVHQRLLSGDVDGALTAAAQARAIGERHGDAELTALATYLRGRATLEGGHVPDGLAILDETMVALSSGELRARIAGLIYCGVIAACHQVCAIGRATEWTEALERFCARQPTMQSFTSKCLIHRAEILQLQGDWPDALAEAERACERFTRGAERSSPAAAHYQCGEVHRMRGELEAAERAYERAGETGGDPQPGLSLLRLAQGRADAAHAALDRALTAATAPLERVRFLPARIEVALAVGDHDAARKACEELSTIAASFETDLLAAHAHHARGAVELATGDASAALRSLGTALECWQRADVPYQAARARLLLAEACVALGDLDGGALQRRAAHAACEQLGASVTLAQLGRTPASSAPPRGDHGLSARELEVLRLVADGSTNKVIARELSLSVKTVDRHVSNILTKLDLPSRSAATAYAYSHGLVSRHR